MIFTSNHVYRIVWNQLLELNYIINLVSSDVAADGITLRLTEGTNLKYLDGFYQIYESGKLDGLLENISLRQEGNLL